MARPRTPTNILALKGAYKKDPQRLKERENEPENTKPIGEPKHLTGLEIEFYNEIIDSTIDGVLGAADRIAVEQAAILLVSCRNLRTVEKVITEAGEDKVVNIPVPASPAEKNQLFKYLGQFGMLPADRSKISIAKPKKKNAFDD